jgi:HAD superfamily hydrolase (TIGR01509 family)
MFDAILFDLDGTLIDTEQLALRTGMEAFAAEGTPVTPDFLRSLVGKDEPTAEGLIRAAMPGIDLDAVNRRRALAFSQGIEAGLPLKPGAAELLARPDLPRALVTSSERRSALRKLAIAGIAGHFAQVVTLDDVTRAKPDPEPYALAARLMGALPARCLVFEDSETGAEAAHRAGCIVVQVPDIVASTGRWAHHLAPDLVTGARMAGLI